MKSIFILALFGLLLTPHTSPAQGKSISDSLVKNLRCNSLNIDTVLSSIRPEAFSNHNHMPLKNWTFRSGLVTLGACWGLGSTQRKLFYLLRTGEPTAPPLNSIAAFDMIRGATLEVTGNLHTKRVFERHLRNYQVIPLSEENIRYEFSRNSGFGLMETLLKGVSYPVNDSKISRDLRGEVERSQERHFFRARNIGMGAGTGAQPPEVNRANLKVMMANAKTNRLTLVNLRLRTTFQHIVIVKSFTQDKNGNVFFKVYDSNQDKEDQVVYFDNATGHFYAPQILGVYQKDPLGVFSNQALGAFVVDEEERADIENSLVLHYKKICSK